MVLTLGNDAAQRFIMFKLDQGQSLGSRLFSEFEWQTGSH